MICLIQRVTSASVSIEGKLYSSINQGFVILLGIFKEDSEKDVDQLVEKIINLRIMSDQEKKMNKSILDTDGQILLVSQFTLCADIAGGRRPSFIKAKNPKDAELLYTLMINKFREKNIKIVTGKFGTYMEVLLANDGPVTLIVDSRNI